MDLSTLNDLTCVALVAAAALTVLAKTAAPGLTSVATTIFALVLPAKESTGLMLALLLIGDTIALWAYRCDANTAVLRRLVPSVLARVGLGALLLVVSTQAQMRRAIGATLLLLVIVTLAQRRGASSRQPGARRSSRLRDARGFHDDGGERGRTRDLDVLPGLGLFSDRVPGHDRLVFLHGEHHQGAVHDRHGPAAPQAPAPHRAAGTRCTCVRMGGAPPGGPHPAARLRASRHRDDNRGDGAAAPIKSVNEKLLARAQGSRQQLSSSGVPMRQAHTRRKQRKLIVEL